MGKFKVVKVKDDGTVEVHGGIRNTLVLSGKRYLLDRIFDTGTHNWDDKMVTHLAIGTSTDTNDGTSGPTPTTPVAQGSGWRGASVYDWKLSDEVARASASFRRQGETVFATATFQNTDFNSYWSAHGTGSVPIVEFGLFLSNTAPTANPLNDVSQQVNAMFARGVKYTTQGTGYYIADPIYKADDGNPIAIGYEFSLDPS